MWGRNLLPSLTRSAMWRTRVCHCSTCYYAAAHARARTHARTHTHTHTHVLRPFFQDYPGEPVPKKGKTSLDFTEARDSEWQWHQLYHMQVGTLLQTDNHASTTPLSFLHAGCPSCRPTNSVKALKDIMLPRIQ